VTPVLYLLSTRSKKTDIRISQNLCVTPAMFWALLAGIAACTNATYFILNKKFLERLNPFQLAAAGFLCSGIFLLILSYIHGIPAIGPGFFGAVLISTFLNIIGTILVFRALSSSDISLSIPMLSFTPLFLVGTSALLLGEFPSAIGILGIFIIVSGSYILNTDTGQERITDPFRAMISHPAILGILIVAFLYAVSINFDKIVLMNTDPYFGIGVECLLLGLSFSLIAIAEWNGYLPEFLRAPVPTRGSTAAQSSGPAPFWYLILAGILGGSLITVEAVAINTAFLLQIVPYVMAIKRMSIILVVLYGTLIFREKEIARRIAGAGLMVLGAVLILVFP
jgi:drug/metabolite transporter (DMT)-like permease